MSESPEPVDVVRETAAELATCGGLRLVAVRIAQPVTFPDIRFLLQAASFGRLEALIAKQWLVVAQAD